MLPMLVLGFCGFAIIAAEGANPTLVVQNEPGWKCIREEK
jgi:hypothetical protein